MSNALLSDETICELIAALDAADTEIETYQATKRDLLTDARERMAGADKAQIKEVIAAVKKAVARIRKERNKPEAAEHDEAASALADHYVGLMSARAPRATHANIPPWSEVKAAANGGGH